MKRILLVACIFLISKLVAGQVNEKNLIKFLTHGNHRTWTLRKATSTLGECYYNGELIVLSADKTGHYKYCQNKQEFDIQFSWDLKIINSFGEVKIIFFPKLRISDGIYVPEVTVYIINDKEFFKSKRMQWTISSTNKLEPSFNIYLTSNN